jgi:hypothetical protein
MQMATDTWQPAPPQPSPGLACRCLLQLALAVERLNLAPRGHKLLLQLLHAHRQRLVVHAPRVWPKLEQQLQIEEPAGGQRGGWQPAKHLSHRCRQLLLGSDVDQRQQYVAPQHQHSLSTGKH